MELSSARSVVPLQSVSEVGSAVVAVPLATVSELSTVLQRSPTPRKVEISVVYRNNWISTGGIKRSQLTYEELSVPPTPPAPSLDWDADPTLASIKSNITNYWYLNEESGTTMSPEIGGVDLTLVGGTVGAIPGGAGMGPDGSNLALYMDASSTYYLISDEILGVAGDFSIWVWVRPTASVGTQNLIHWDSAASSDYIYFLNGNSFSTARGATGYPFKNPAGSNQNLGRFPEHTWSLWVVTRSGEDYYINYRGVPCGTSTPGTALDLSTSKLVIGRIFSPAFDGFNGGFAHVGYMPGYVLSNRECSLIWNNGFGRYPTAD